MTNAFTIPDIKEISEMKSKFQSPPSQSLRDEVLQLNVQMHEALIAEKNIPPNELRKLTRKYENEFNDNYHQLLGPKVPDLSKLRVSESEKNRIMSTINTTEFKEASTYREQIGVLCTQLRNDTEKPVISYNTIGSLFSRTGGAIKAEEKKFCKGPTKNGRPTILNSEEEKQLFKIIEDMIEKEGFPTLIDIQDAIYTNFGKVLITATIREIINRLGYKVALAEPMEKERYEFDEKLIDDYFVKLSRLLDGVPIGWLYNIDETGQQDFVDAREIHIVVRKEIDVKGLKYPVDRNGKRSTLIHCICSDGTFLNPLFVLPRKTIDDEVFDALSPTSVVFDHSP